MTGYLLQLDAEYKFQTLHSDKFVKSENNITSFNLPSPKLTSSSEHEPASCFTNLSSLFFASGLLLNVGILLPGNSFSVALRIRVRLMI